MMNKSKKYIAIAFVVVLIVVVIVSTVGILSLKNKPEILQGQAEATEIRDLPANSPDASTSSWSKRDRTSSKGIPWW